MTHSGAASFTIYGNTKEFLRTRDLLSDFTFLNVAGAGGLGGAMAGALISFGSARELAYLKHVERC